MKHIQAIISLHTVTITILNEMTVQMQILLCSSWSNIQTLTQNTQLASKWFRAWHIQHVAKQQGQHTIQLSRVQKRALLHLRWAITPNRQSSPLVDIVKQMKGREAWRQQGSERSERCAAYDLKRYFWRWKERKRTVEAMKRTRNRSRIMWRGNLLCEQSEFNT
jgi:hypothetical protein